MAFWRGAAQLMALSGLDGFMNLCLGRTGGGDAAGVLSGNVAAEKDQEGHCAEDQRFACSARLKLRVLLALPLPALHLVSSKFENLFSGLAAALGGREIWNHK